MTTTDIELHEGPPQIVTRHDLRNSTTDSWTDVLADIGELASKIAGTDFVPAAFKGSVPAVAATILTGRELGFAPMTALASLHSIKGRVGLAAEAMRALVLQAGHEIVTSTSTSSQCTMKGRRRGSDEWTEVTWTIADARQAGLLNGSGWKNYPRQMLQARASTELCRLAFPDVIRGLASLEEIDDYDVLPGATVTSSAGGDGDKPVKRAARKRAAAPKADPAEPPPLPDGEAAAPEAPAPADEPPAPDLPDSSPSAEPESADVDEDRTPRDAHEGESAGEAPAEGEAPDLPDPDPEIVDAEIVDESAAVEDINDLGNMPANQGQIGLIVVHFNRLGMKDRDVRLEVTRQLIGREVESSKHLTFKEATSVLHVLESAKDEQALMDILIASESGA